MYRLFRLIGGLLRFSSVNKLRTEFCDNIDLDKVSLIFPSGTSDLVKRADLDKLGLRFSSDTKLRIEFRDDIDLDKVGLPFSSVTPNLREEHFFNNVRTTPFPSP